MLPGTTPYRRPGPQFTAPVVMLQVHVHPSRACIAPRPPLACVVSSCHAGRSWPRDASVAAGAFPGPAQLRDSLVSRSAARSEPHRLCAGWWRGRLPDGSLACFAVRQYSWDEKKFDNQLWIADLATAASLTDEERQQGQSPPSAGPHLAWRPAASSGWPPSSSGEPPSQSPISAYFGHPGAGCARPPYAAHRGVAARLQQRV